MNIFDENAGKGVDMTGIIWYHEFSEVKTEWNTILVKGVIANGADETEILN